MMRLKFCFVTTFYPPHNFGGDGIGVQRLARGLARRGHAVTVVYDLNAFEALSGRTIPDAPLDPFGVEVVPLRNGLGWISPLLTQQIGRPIVNGRRLARLFRESRFDVINFNNISLVGGPSLLAYGAPAVKIYFAHEHWLVCPTHVLWRHGRELCTGRECLKCVLHYRRPPQLWRYTGHLERQLRNVDVFLAMSEFSRAKHREFGFPREMEVLPYFLPDESVDEAVSSLAHDSDRPHDRPYFLFVGRLEPIKGLGPVIRLFRDYADADLLIAGDGDHRAALQRVAEGNARVRFLGRVPNDQLPRYYRHAIALVVPSVCYETFGIVIIESFRYRTPVIARRIGPFPEILEQSKGGELFSTEAELVAAMRLLQRDVVRRDEMARSGHEAFRERWSESAVVPKYLELVRRAIERRLVPVESARWAMAASC